MEKNKNCPRAATPEQQIIEDGSFGEVSSSIIQCTICAGQISSLLSHGQENAVPLRHLKTMTGLDGRVIRQKIQQERLAGVPILSDNCRGYYLAATAEEVNVFSRSMRHRAREIMQIADAVQRSGVK